MSSLPEVIITLGPEGSFHEIAVRHHFPDAKLLLADSFEGIFQAVRKGNGAGFVVVNNSVTGAFAENRQQIEKEFKSLQKVSLEFDLCLAAPHGTQERNIKTVMSHPQAFDDCEDYIYKTLPYATRQACYSTAAAAKEITSAMKPHAAVICHPETALKYGLNILANKIEIPEPNMNEFVLFDL